MGAKTVFGSAALLLVAGTAVVVWRASSALDSAETAGLRATIEAQKATIEYQSQRLKVDYNEKSKRDEPAKVESNINYSDLDSVTNVQLKSEAIRLVEDLRKFGATYDNAQQMLFEVQSKVNTNADRANEEWRGRVNSFMEIRFKENYQWQTRFRGRVIPIYSQLCKRLGILPVGVGPIPSGATDIRTTEANSVLMTGTLAGAQPLQALADYLQSLAAQLH